MVVVAKKFTLNIKIRNRAHGKWQICEVLGVQNGSFCRREWFPVVGADTKCGEQNRLRREESTEAKTQDNFRVTQSALPTAADWWRVAAFHKSSLVSKTKERKSRAPRQMHSSAILREGFLQSLIWPQWRPITHVVFVMTCLLRFPQSLPETKVAPSSNLRFKAFFLHVQVRILSGPRTLCVWCRYVTVRFEP